MKVSDLIKEEEKQKKRKEKDEQIFLTHLINGHQALKVLGGSYGWEYDYDHIEDKKAVEAIRTFIEVASDIMDIYDMFEISEKMDTEETLDDLIKDLNKYNLYVFGTKMTRKIRDAQGVVDLPICSIRIVKGNNPEIVQVPLS
ncbi:hypothetical protein GA0061096_3591 [Fictibacillus enclensis]|nr:hypothetical protein GA0061096_3591 [Fictibacillus enclensis]